MLFKIRTTSNKTINTKLKIVKLIQDSIKGRKLIINAYIVFVKKTTWKLEVLLEF